MREAGRKPLMRKELLFALAKSMKRCVSAVQLKPPMDDASPHHVTELLIAWGDGDRAALDQLMPLVYEELRRLAHRYIKRERPNHTLQTSGLVNEAYLRLVDQSQLKLKNRAHFFGIAARLMRQILVDYARKRKYAKRGGDAQRIPFEEILIVSDERAADIVALDDALKELSEIDPRQSQIVELRFFGGLSIEEAAQVLDVSPGTVMRDWTLAKAWLRMAVTS
jgi:RNA polymerase sigma-70 factor (ECF subfamily)